ncbi:MAG: DNA alkylation repair protein [Bacteroidales bacterium]|nr:DNA alkylation repair protein [Bacteroidales bacterium]
MDNLIDSIRSDLKSQATEQNRIAGERFFKENVKLYGLKAAQVQTIAKHYFSSQVKMMSKSEMLALCEQLWQSGFMEETFIACYFTERFVKHFSPEDFVTLEEWVKKYINNWASCDTFCNHSIGDMLMLHPQLIEKVKLWAKSNNRWVRRAAAVSFIVPARKGLFHNHIADIATMLLTDSDDMVQKGYGWMLKATSQSNQELVFNFVMSNKAKMPRTALRYAIEKMPLELKAKAMAK